MTIAKKIRSIEIYMGKLRHGSDLLEELGLFCLKQGIQLGRVEAIGAVQNARLGYYDQQTRQYQFLVLNEEFEITKLNGNVSLKDGKPFVHAHVTIADESGKCYGGHLAPGTMVYACEFIMEAFEGPIFERVSDEKTGLPLWNI